MDADKHGQKNETKRLDAGNAERCRASWSAAGSEAPRRFRPGGAGGMCEALCAHESGVAAALCHRSPRHGRDEEAD